MTKDNTPSGETVSPEMDALFNSPQWAAYEASLRNLIEVMVQEVIGSPLSINELKPHAMNDAAAKKMRQGSELTVDAQLERAEVKINKLFGKE